MFNLLLAGTYFEYYLMGIILIPGVLLAIYAQSRVSMTFARCNKIKVQSGKTGGEVARMLLDTAGLQDITIQVQGENMSDYYDHKNKVISLSKNSFSNDTVAALGVAIHEVGHALQYKSNYAPIKLRTFAITCSNISSKLLWPLVILGFIFGFGSMNGAIGNYFVWAGLIFFGLSVLVNLVTLPVEYNASRRATKILQSSGILNTEETAECKKMLSAAALTYLASFVVSILELLRFFIVFVHRNND